MVEVRSSLRSSQTTQQAGHGCTGHGCTGSLLVGRDCGQHGRGEHESELERQISHGKSGRKSTNSGATEPLVSLTTLSVTSVRDGSEFSVCRRGFRADRDHCCLYVITVSGFVIIEQRSCRAVVVVEFHHFRLPGHPRRWNQARYRTYQRPIQLTSSLGHDTHL